MEWEWEWQAPEAFNPWQASLERSQARRKRAHYTRLLRRTGWMLFGMLAVVAAGLTLSSSDGKSATSPSRHVQAKASTLGWLPKNTPYRDLILKASAQTGVEAALLAGLVETESDFNPEESSSAGAYGLTQLMPESAAAVGVPYQGTIWEQLLGGAREFMMHKRQFGSTELALAAYNAGPGAVQRYGGIPPYSETQAYVPRVLHFRQKYLRP
jgi:soluble lytic murein transglycosylase-like protein